jgi:hypothetical protein
MIPEGVAVYVVVLTKSVITIFPPPYRGYSSFDISSIYLSIGSADIISR